MPAQGAVGHSWRELVDVGKPDCRNDARIKLFDSKVEWGKKALLGLRQLGGTCSPLSSQPLYTQS